jgi:glyceraldehyde-3-phosphate dehydrogenase/erythrose-4-phosphate dehydrogenase
MERPILDMQCHHRFRVQPIRQLGADAGVDPDDAFVNVVAWIHNEWGHSNGCLEMGKVTCQR